MAGIEFPSTLSSLEKSYATTAKPTSADGKGPFLAREEAMGTRDQWVWKTVFDLSHSSPTYIRLAHHGEVKNTINTTSFAKSVVVRSTTVQDKFALNFH